MNDLASADHNIHAAMLEVISEGISGGLLVYDTNDLVVFASRQLCDLLPVPMSFLTPGTRLRELLAAVYDSGGRFAADGPGTSRALSRKDWVGEQIAALWRERSVTLERRAVDRWLNFSRRRLSSGYGVTVVRDVSEHKRREEQWRLDMERMEITEEVLDNLPFPITVRDDRLTFVAVNKAAASFHDLPAAAILGRSGKDLHAPELAQRLSGINRQVIESGEATELPELVTRNDGSQVVIIARKFRIGKPGHYYLVTVMEDITSLVMVNEASGEFAPRLTVDDLTKSRLGRSADLPSQEWQEVHATTRDNGRVLVVSASPKLTTDIIAVLSALGADSSAIESAADLRLFLDLAADSGVDIDLVVIDSAAGDICGDILQEHGIAVMSVDDGCTRHELVSGMRRMLDMVTGGRIAVAAGKAVLQIEATANRPATIDVLVAEDNEVNQIVFSQLLEGFGYRYAIAVDGQEAVRLWKECSPRLVLMDITLPALTGFEAAAMIRSLEAGAEPVPIIGVLPLAFDRDRESCFAAGMSDVLLKPVSPEALEAVFRAWLGFRPLEQSRRY